jgi:hypothetical protein
MRVEIASDIFGYSQVFALREFHDHGRAKWERMLAGEACPDPLFTRVGDVFVFESDVPGGATRWDVDLRVPCSWLEEPLRAALARAAAGGLPFAADENKA